MTGRVVYASCQWGVLVVIAQLGTAEQLGNFTFALALTAPIVIFAQLNMRAVLATDAKDDHALSEYLVSRLGLATIALAVVAGIANLASSSFEAFLIIIGVGLFKYFESISDIIAGFLQKIEKMEKTAISNIFRGVASIAAITASMYITDDMTHGIYLIAFLWLSTLLFYDLRNVLVFQKHWTRPSNASMRRLLVACVPLGFVGLLTSLNTNVSLYAIEHYLGLEMVGYFSAMLYVIVTGRLISGPLAQAAAPQLSRLYAAGQVNDFQSLLIKLLGFGGLVGLAGVAIAGLWGDIILSFLYSAEYSRYSYVFIWIMVAGGIGYVTTFLGTSLTIARLFREMLALHVTTNVVLIVLLIVLVPEFGLLGAAWAMVAGGLTTAGLSLALYRFRVISPIAIPRPSERPTVSLDAP